MTLATVTLQVDSELAQAYRSASKETKSKLQMLMNLWLREYAVRSSSLAGIMDEMSDKAMQRGLTEDRLEELLREC